MNTLEVHRSKQRLEGLFERGKSLLEDPEMQSHWARYLCVLVSGFLETSIQTIYTEYANDKAAPNIRNFVQDRLKSFMNPNMEKILALARAFNSEWADSLETDTRDRLKTSVDSIVALRHQIAHGQSVGLSFSMMSQYYRDATKVVDLVEEQCRR